MTSPFSLKHLIGIFTIPLFFACAPKVSVVSSTSQVYYPGRQEEKPFQEVVITLDTLYADITMDSLMYGGQTLDIKKNRFTLRSKANGTTFSNNATLYYTRKNKQGTIRIDSIMQLKPLYLP
ncbi:MAG: hypothetical protein Crog4KO_19760 [Crocinitomicaceae bacterium]